MKTPMPARTFPPPFKYYTVSNRCESDPRVYDITVCELLPEFDPAILAVSPGTPCTSAASD